MPDTKCPICQPDLPAADIKICESCKVKLQVMPIIKEAAINAIAEACSDSILSCITDPKQQKHVPRVISTDRIGIIGTCSYEVGLGKEIVMAGINKNIIIVNSDISIANPTLPKPMVITNPYGNIYSKSLPLTRKERRKQKRKSK